MNIYFEETAYSIYEGDYDDKRLTVELSLDKPAFTNFSVNVTDVNITAKRKLCSMHTYACIHSYYIT